MSVFTAAGCKLFISLAAPATHDASGFAALSWTEINDVTDLGQGLAPVSNPVEYSPLSKREVQVRKGSFNSGSQSIVMGKNDADAGQGLLTQAGAGTYDAPASFKLIYQDGSIDYYQALVLGVAKNIGTIDNIVQRSSELRVINGGVVEVPA